MSRARLVALLVALAGSLPAQALAAELRVVTTTPSLADLARQVGGERVEASSLMRGPENPHNVVPKPSFALRLRKADLFVHLGLDAEPWVPNLVRSARQARLLAGGDANVDASRGIALLEVPAAGGLSRALGDIHVYGNPHYLLDPLNGIVVSRTLAEAFTRADPQGASLYAANATALGERLRALASRLEQRLSPWIGAPVVVYHRTWPYFLKRFGLVEAGTVEPKPGIVPGPGHLAALEEQMRAEGVHIVLLETFSNERIAERLADGAGARKLVLAQEVDALQQAGDYETLFTWNVEQLVRALEAQPPGDES